MHVLLIRIIDYSIFEYWTTTIKTINSICGLSLPLLAIYGGQFVISSLCIANYIDSKQMECAWPTTSHNTEKNMVHQVDGWSTIIVYSIIYDKRLIVIYRIDKSMYTKNCVTKKRKKKQTTNQKRMAFNSCHAISKVIKSGR